MNKISALLKKKITISYHTIANVFVLILLIIFAITNWNVYYPNHSWTTKISIVSIALLIYQLTAMKMNKIKIYDFRI